MKIVECSRDAMQGINEFIPTETKIAYLNQLLNTGFNIIDAGSFVNPKIIPQMADTKEVLESINKNNITKISVIVANQKGVQQAMAINEVDILGFPFSLSETFQKRNTNKTQDEAFSLIQEINNDIKGKKELLIYLSMVFGNPYGDKWEYTEVIKWVEKLAKLGVTTINLSDTIGVAKIDQIELLFKTLITYFPEIEFGSHFHTGYYDWKEKITAAYDNGCRRFEGAIRGFGGCPMAKNSLVGNMPTEHLVGFANDNHIPNTIDIKEFKISERMAKEIF